jgi:DUF1009 family protein
MNGKLGVIAGAGALPRAVIAAARDQGRAVFVIALEGQAERETTHDVDHVWLRLGALGEGVERLRDAGVSDVVMIGSVRRPSLAELRPDWRGTRLLARIGMRAFGDDGLLAAIVRELEEEGFRVIGVEQVLGDLVAECGSVGARVAGAEDEIDIARAVAVLRAIGPLDVGQAAIVERGVVLGIEAAEGTDALIERCASLKRQAGAGVLVKIAKPGQERRVDLPTIGVETVERVARSGFAGIAVEAGGALIVDRRAVAARADERGVFVVGVVTS